PAPPHLHPFPTRRSSDLEAAISTASTPSPINSPAPTPTIPTPSTHSLLGSTINLVNPSVRPSVRARPEAIQGKRLTVTSRPCLRSEEHTSEPQSPCNLVC